MKPIIGLLIFFMSSYASGKTFTEFDLVQMIENSPQLKGLEAQVERLESEINGVMVNFSPTLDAALKYNNTKEPPLIFFNPAPEPFYSAEVKLNHNTLHGVGYSLGLLGESFETAPSNDPTVFTFNSARLNPTFSVSMDLLKNRLGSETGNQVKSLKSRQKALILEKEILKERLAAEIRKLFWTHNILNEKRKLNISILGLSEKLQKDIRKKKKQGFAESGDLYSVESQTAGQKTNIALLTYRIGLVKKTLSTTLPDLPGNFELQTVEMDTDAEKVFFKCLNAIISKKETPFELSYVSEQLKEKNTALAFTEASLESFSKPSLKFFGQISGSHVDNRLMDASSDYLAEARYGFSVGLNFSMPLTNYMKKQRENLIKAERYQINSENESIKSELTALHIETVNSINLLNNAFADQKASTLALAKSYNFKQKQYNQARADLFEVIREQDKYLMSQLNQLDIIQIIVDSLLNYKSKFQKFSCQGVTL